MNFIRQYSLIVGISVLIGVAVLLLSSSDLLFSSGVSFIDTDPQSTTGDEIYVETKSDFGSPTYMDNLPMEIGEWKGYEYPVDNALYKTLGAEHIEMRGYTKPGSFQPIFLAIVQAKADSAFHAPEICYPSQGYEVQESGRDEVVVADPAWANQVSDLSVPMKRLVVAKKRNDVVIDRRVVLFWYVRGNQYSTDTMTMVRISAQTAPEGPYDQVLEREKEFIAACLPYLFEPRDDETWRPIAMELIDWGPVGYVLIGSLLLMPVGIILYPKTSWGKRAAEKSHDRD